MSGRHAEFQFTEGIAHRINRIADTQIITVSQQCRAQPGCINFQHRYIVVRFHADDLGIILGTVIGHDLDVKVRIVGVFNHMVIGENVAVVRNDEAGPADGAGTCHTEEIGHRNFRTDTDHLLQRLIIYFRRVHQCRSIGNQVVDRAARCVR